METRFERSTPVKHDQRFSLLKRQRLQVLTLTNRVSLRRQFSDERKTVYFDDL